ncbi:MAG: hypothetical protein IKV61_00865 [Clostridia bacterium]|nr:hypothetical protein [Clostridia bacterium]
MVFKRAKIFILIFIAIFVFYFTSDFALLNIEKTAFIVSLGIDKVEDEYSVTAQIAVPETSIGQSSNDESVITASGKTLYSAVTKIGEMTGWYPKLSFCNLIILGESMLSENVFNVIDFFIRSYKVEDSAILCACYGLAKEVLLSHSPLDNISGLSLAKIFVRDYNGASRILTTSIKEFSIGYYSRSESAFMPKVKTVETDIDSKSGAQSASTLSEPSSGSANESEGKKAPVIYDATTSLYFYKGEVKGELTNDESLCYSLTIRNAKDSYISVNSINDDGIRGNFLFGIEKVQNNKYLTFNGNEPTLNINLNVWLSIIDTNFAEDIDSVSNLGEMTDKMLYDCKVHITNTITEVFNKTKSAGCDLFKIKNEAYKRHTKEYEKHKLTLLENCKLNLNVNCINNV